MIWFFTKLQHFTSEQIVFLIGTLTSSAFNGLSQDEQNNLRFLFSKIDSTTSAQIKKDIVSKISDTIILGDTFVVYRVSEGEDFEIVIEKENTGDVYEPHVLVAREDSLGTILAEKAATNSNIQLLPFEDLSLTGDKIYKIRVQLEENTGAGNTNNEALAKLATFFFVVSKNIDSE